MPEELSLPPAIRDHVVALIRLLCQDRDPEAKLAALPDTLPEGKVRMVVSGGAFGWLMQARLDVIDGRLALEVLEDSRMSGPEHYRVWEDGTVEPLANEHTEYSYPSDATPEEIEAVKARYFAHNRSVQAQLRERGFPV